MENYGKFSSAEELLKGYTELEKSFTQKCQQLSALEKQINSAQNSGTNGDSDRSPSPQQDAMPQRADESVGVQTVPPSQSADSSDGCTSVASDIPPRVMTGGGNTSCALPNRPKTLQEASDLAKKYFN